MRVHGATNRVSLANFPGYAEADGQPKDCTDCVGRFLLRKGAAVPVNHAQNSVVREEELPKNTRILRGSEGIGKLPNPIQTA